VTARRELYWLVYSVVVAIPILVITYASLTDPVSKYTRVFLASILQFTAGATFYSGAYRSLKNRSTNMDVLVSVGISAAYFYSMIATLLPSAFAEGKVFFETPALLISFIRCGKWLEARAKRSANEALEKLLSLQAPSATLVGDGKERRVPVSEVEGRKRADRTPLTAWVPDPPYASALVLLLPFVVGCEDFGHGYRLIAACVRCHNADRVYPTVSFA